MMTFSLDEAFILSIWLELLLYGCLVPLFLASLYVLGRKASSTSLNKPMVFAAISMFTLATAHVSVNLRRLLNGYIWGRDPVMFFSDLDAPTHLAKDMIYTAQSLLGDAFAIYRCYIVWDRSMGVVALPLILLVCSTFSGGIVSWLFTCATDGASVFESSLYGWITAFYSLALAQNLITTALIAYKIWMRDRDISVLRVSSASDYLPIVAIVVESATVYVVAQLVLIVLYVQNCNAQYIVLETITPTVGLVFMSIIVRVGLRSHPMQTRSAPQYRRSSESYSMRRVAIKVSTHQVTHVEGPDITPTTLEEGALEPPMDDRGTDAVDWPRTEVGMLMYAQRQPTESAEDHRTAVVLP